MSSLREAGARVALLGADPVPWILASDEPSARWVVLTRVLDRPGDDAEVVATRAESVADDRTSELLDRLPDWEDPGESHSFGQKKTPSPFATATVLAVLARVGGLAAEIALVDVTSLGSSKGGSGAPVPP